MKKDGNIQNLKSYKKGETGNPHGRPPVLPELKTAIAKLLSEKSGDYTALDGILRALFKRAMSGDVRAAQELLDRGFGKSQQLIELAAKDIQITGITFDDTD